jgi:hypothetical protein
VQEAYCEYGDAEGEEPAANYGLELGRRAGFRHDIPPEIGSYPTRDRESERSAGKIVSGSKD